MMSGMSKPASIPFGVVREKNVRIPMRDGVELSANLFRPAGAGRYPGLLLRTPYGKPAERMDRLVRAGYAVVCQDCRGRYESDGDFRSLMSDAHREAEDGYDSVEWLAAQEWCNGKVGTFGVSYNAWTQWMLAKLKPPHLKAMAPWSIPEEGWQIDWTGSFRPGRRLRWLLTTMAPDLRRRQGLPPPHTKEEANRIWTEIEQGRFLSLLPLAHLAEFLPEPLGSEYLDFLNEPLRPVWRFEEAHKVLTVPTLSVTGWFDHCCSLPNFHGARKHGATALARRQAKVIIGPYAHATLCQRLSGGFDFGPDAALDHHDILIRWFDRWLKDQPNGVDRDPPVRYFVMGSNEWKHDSVWPPALTKERIDFLGAKGKLVGKPPKKAAPDQYQYDPADPTPTLWDPDLVQTTSDRNLLNHRADILRYRSRPVDKPFEIAGYPEVTLFASSSAPDTDFFAHLAVETKEGKAMEIAHGMVRASSRRSRKGTAPLSPDQIEEFQIRMGPTAYRFSKGDVIRLELSSADFPNYDRNHNTGGNDLFESDMAIAKQKVFHDAGHPSRLRLPVTS